MTLDDLNYRVLARVTGFDAHLNEVDSTRLHNLGLRPGSVISKLLSLPFGDPIECLVGQQLVTLDKIILKQVHVEIID